MYIELTPQALITAGAVVGAVSGLVALFVKLVRWVDRQKAQDLELQKLREHHDHDTNNIQEELTLLTYGILSCLKGLQEQGCNGPVTDAINKMEKHMNKAAHDQKEANHGNH